jgi:hypothetical protein
MYPALIQLAARFNISASDKEAFPHLWETAHGISAAVLRQQGIAHYDSDSPNSAIRDRIKEDIKKEIILQTNGIMPLRDNSGKITFTIDKINGVTVSDVSCSVDNEKAFKMSFELISEQLTLLGYTDTYLILAKGNRIQDSTSNGGIDLVFFFKIGPEVVLKNYRTIDANL